MSAQPVSRAVRIKRRLVGRPLATGELGATLVPKRLALPIFSSDALSSVAYATEAALVVIVSVSVADRGVLIPISVTIAALLAVVALSYTRIVRVYSTSGGAYVVAKDNLGTLPSLVAAASLLIDYTLTVAVSVSAGVFAITSAAPSLRDLRLELALAFVVLIALLNLRGVREAGLLFAFPTYGFIVSLYLVLAVGGARCLDGCPSAEVPEPIAVGAGVVGIGVALRAFASGSSALTGVEAISNGVGAFREPKGRNAALTIVAMAAIAITLFLGVSLLAYGMDALPSKQVSVLSEIARAAFPGGSPSHFLFYVVQAFTFAILVLAANTSFQGFPRLAAVVAHDGYFPRQFANLGDRLVFSNGVLALAILALLLILAFDANVDSLIHLYVLGVFIAFTLSQAGMVRHWLRVRGRGWQLGIVLNGVGAVVTLLVSLVVLEAKFLEGAWIVTVAIPVLIAFFYAVHRHYGAVSEKLAVGDVAPARPGEIRNRVVLAVEQDDDATSEARWYAHALAGDSVDEVPAAAARRYVEKLPHGGGELVTVVIPETFRRRSLVDVLHARLTFRLKLELLRDRGVVVADVPRLAHEGAFAAKRIVGVVLVNELTAASVRAIRYARSLGLGELRALSIAVDGDEEEKLRLEWQRNAAALGVRLDVAQAPYRDLGAPLLDYLREITADPDVVAVVFLPELVIGGWRAFLHNQHALFVKRLLVFEPRVILSSVPFHLKWGE